MVGSVVLYDIASGFERVLAEGPRPIIAAEWSPLGDQVAYLRYADCAPAVLGGNGSYTVALEQGVIDLASGRVTSTSLGSTTLLPGPIRLRWTGQSASLAGRGAETASLDGRFVVESSLLRDLSHRLEVVDRTTGEPAVELGVGAAAEWSPDGTSLAFIAPAVEAEADGLRYVDRLVVASVDTWQARGLANVIDGAVSGIELVGPVSWTSDSRSIYWIDLTGGHVVDVASGRLLALPAALAGCLDPQWQPSPTSERGG
jgi:dipeptidyl aminopeptidase/acylaminoacyl peptidase